MARNVFVILDEIASGIQELKVALAPFAASSGSGAHRRRRSSVAVQGLRRRTAAAGRSKGSVTTKVTGRASVARRKRKSASPKIRALRALQGKYLGSLRSLTLPQRAQVKKAKADGGYEPALKLAASLKK